jgi:hypothetical protein
MPAWATLSFNISEKEKTRRWGRVFLYWNGVEFN